MVAQNRNRILGRNERSLLFIKEYNTRASIMIADNKILTKKVLIKNNIPVSKLIAIIKDENQLESFDWNKLPESFVIKPVTGYEGSGIEIFYNKDKSGNWIKGDGSRYSMDRIKILAKSILNGEYSLHNTPDKIIIEERVKLHKDFKYYTYRGAPDVRIIVFNKIPVMSYIRIPTKESDGKANLAKGAIGCGIDMSKGVTTYALIGKSKLIEYLPGSKTRLSGIRIPYWDKILKYAVETSICTNLGFVGVDFLIDKDLGPVVVEINARPGLSVQLANHDGLRWRLKKVRDIRFKSVEKSIRLAKDLFGGEIEEEIKDITGKAVIGLTNQVTLSYKERTALTHLKVDPSIDYSQIDKKLLLEELKLPSDLFNVDFLGQINSVSEPEKPLYIENLNKELREKYDFFEQLVIINEVPELLIKLDMSINEEEEIHYFIVKDRSNSIYKILLGKKSLTRYLIDASK
ncbi:MAG: sugar-transfer associated ATP-grasp domain-containing protein [bacterium]